MLEAVAFVLVLQWILWNILVDILVRLFDEVEFESSCPQSGEESWEGMLLLLFSQLNDQTLELLNHTVGSHLTYKFCLVRSWSSGFACS